jgi:hypothetical protein
MLQRKRCTTRCQHVAPSQFNRPAVCHTTNVKGFGFPKPFLMETLLLDLAFDDLEARIGIQFELIA